MKIFLFLSLAMSTMASHSQLRQTRYIDERVLATVPLTVNVLMDPNYVDPEAEASYAETALQQRGLPTVAISTIEEFLDGVSSAEGLMMPELEAQQIPVELLTETRITALQEFVKSGKPLVLTIDAFNYVERFLVEVFGFASLEYQWASSAYFTTDIGSFAEGPDRANTVWKDVDRIAVKDLDGVYQHQLSIFPEGTLVAYKGESDEYGTVLQVPYESGWIYLIGFDFYNALSVDCECWKDIVSAPFFYNNQFPVAQCQDSKVYVNDLCQAQVLPEAVNNGSTDPDGTITDMYFVGGGTTFEVGTTAVTMAVVDDMNGVSTCTADIIAIDAIAPTIQCRAPTSQQWTGKTICYTATSRDNCPGCETSTVKVVSHTCKKQVNGRLVDITGTTQCKVELVGAQICVTSISTTVFLNWMVAATDCSGNLKTRTCGRTSLVMA